MSQIGGPIQAGLAGTGGTQESTGKAQAKRERQATERSRRFQDALDLTVAGLEASEAIHGLNENDEHAQQDAKRKGKRETDASTTSPDSDVGPDGPRHIDLTG